MWNLAEGDTIIKEKYSKVPGISLNRSQMHTIYKGFQSKQSNLFCAFVIVKGTNGIQPK